MRCMVFFAGVFALGCQSPVEDDIIESLGPEVEGLEEGEYHRYGQPCMVCHGGYNVDSPVFVAAGTVFATADADIPVQGAIITLTDATGDTILVPTNCTGNFYIAEDTWAPVFPLRAEIDCPLPDGTRRRSVMETRLNRDGGCASCHEKGAATQFSPGQVFCLEEQPEQPYVVPSGCPGGPNGVGTSE